jgi:hypothetical protein
LCIAAIDAAMMADVKSVAGMINPSLKRESLEPAHISQKEVVVSLQ